MKNILIILFCVGLFTACTMTKPLVKRDTSIRASQNDVRLRANMTKKDSLEKLKELERLTKNDTTKKTFKDLYQAYEYDEKGNLVMNMSMEEVIIRGRSRSVAERNGKIRMLFNIAVPQGVQHKNLSTIIEPILVLPDSNVILAPMQIMGATYNFLSDREEYLLARRKNADKRKEKYITMIGRDTSAVFDTMINLKGKNIRFFNHNYTYDYPVVGDIELVNIAFKASLVALDGSSYPLICNDTLPFRITSLLKFYDTRDRYIQKIISKYQKVNDIRNIVFNVNSSEIIDTLSNNRFELRRVSEVMDSIYALQEFNLDSVNIKASASPEGSYSLNEKLSKARGESLRTYLSKISKMAERQIKLSTIVEDWDLLHELVRKDSLIVKKENLMSIIKSSAPFDERESQLKQTTDYKYIFDKLYPQLRSVVFTYNITRSKMTKDTLYTQEIDTNYRKGVDLLLNRKYNEACEALRVYNCRNYAIGLVSLGYNTRAMDVLKSQPIDDAYSHYLLAIVYARLGDNILAEEKYREAVKYDKYLRFRGALDPEISQLNVVFNDEEIE